MVGVSCRCDNSAVVDVVNHQSAQDPLLYHLLRCLFNEAYNDGIATTIDEPYVSGVSLTHGIPREHIWTFAAGRTSALATTSSSPLALPLPT